MRYFQENTLGRPPDGILCQRP